MITIPELPVKGEKVLYVCNHSGGKDSQAMYNLLKRIVPSSQLVVIHAHLRGVEWEGTIEHIKDTISHEFFIVEAKKSFFDMVNHRKMFPSSANRQCTSDLKRGPIQKKIIELCNTRGFDVVVNCMGLRAEESSNRAKKKSFKKNETNSNSKRDWFEWLPIHNWTTEKVFDWISFNYQKPHWAYSKGMSRLSCCFCIMASENDLKIAATLNPELLQKYSELEKTHNHTLIMPTQKHGKRFLIDIVKPTGQMSIF